jgi:hypothetical protein
MSETDASLVRPLPQRCSEGRHDRRRHTQGLHERGVAHSAGQVLHTSPVVLAMEPLDELEPGSRWRRARFPSGKHPIGDATARDCRHSQHHRAWCRCPRVASSMGVRPRREPHVPTASAAAVSPPVVITRDVLGDLETPDLSIRLPIGYGPCMSSPLASPHLHGIKRL